MGRWGGGGDTRWTNEDVLEIISDACDYGIRSDYDHHHIRIGWDADGIVK